MARAALVGAEAECPRGRRGGLLHGVPGLLKQLVNIRIRPFAAQPDCPQRGAQRLRHALEDAAFLRALGRGLRHARQQLLRRQPPAFRRGHVELVAGGALGQCLAQRAGLALGDAVVDAIEHAIELIAQRHAQPGVSGHFVQDHPFHLAHLQAVSDHRHVDRAVGVLLERAHRIRQLRALGRRQVAAVLHVQGELPELLAQAVRLLRHRIEVLLHLRRMARGWGVVGKHQLARCGGRGSGSRIYGDRRRCRLLARRAYSFARGSRLSVGRRFAWPWC